MLLTIVSMLNLLDSRTLVLKRTVGAGQKWRAQRRTKGQGRQTINIQYRKTDRRTTGNETRGRQVDKYTMEVNVKER